MKILTELRSLYYFMSLANYTVQISYLSYSRFIVLQLSMWSTSVYGHRRQQLPMRSTQW